MNSTGSPKPCRPLVPACALLATALLSPTAMSQNDFASWVGYETGQAKTARNPYDIAIADFDHDGDPDVAVANWRNYPQMAVLYNNGDGTYAAPALYSAKPSYGIVAADFDSDGWDDIMTTDSTAKSVSLFLNAGDGTFTPRQQFSVGPGPHGLVAADFDADGDLDVVVANNRFPSDTVSLLINNGSGSFAAAVNFVAAPSTSDMPSVVTAPDLDGDGLPDIVVGNENQYMTVLLNLGSGTFAPAVSQSTGLGARAGAYPSIAAHDVDRDGDIDVLYSNSLTQVLVTQPRVTNAGAVAAFLNDGTGTLASAIGYRLLDDGVGFADMALADVTGDGWDDIVGVWQANQGWGYAAADGMGGFLAAVDYASGDEPMCLAMADVDADTDVDALIVARNSLELAVHRNPGNGDFSIAPVFAAGYLQNRNMAAGDVDGDGDLDIATCWASFGAGSIDILLNNGNGTFARQVNYNCPQGARNVKLGDLDGDGDLDLAWADDSTSPPYNFWTRMNNGNGTFGPLSQWQVGTCGTWELELLDVDADGDLDVVLCELLGCFAQVQKWVYVNLNNGNGTFAPPNQFPAGGSYDVVGGDFNEDGTMDLVLSTGVGIEYLEGTGGGNFTVGVVTPFTGGMDRITSADFDGDGHLDVAFTGYDPASDPAVRVLLGVGDGTFGAASLYPASFSGVRYIIAGDADADGDPDLLVGNISSYDVSLFRNRGDGTFEAQMRYGTSGGPQDLTFGDFTGDGTADIAVLMGDTVASWNTLAGVQVLPGIPRCAGYFTSYGTGLPGTGNVTPFQSASGCPVQGSTMTWQLANGLANAPAAFWLGTASASLPFLGGTVLLGGSVLGVPVQLDANGAFSVTTTIPTGPTIPGAVFYSQFVVVDAGAPMGIAFSSGLATHIQ